MIKLIYTLSTLCINSVTTSVNFTYNVTDGSSIAGVSNCSLYLGYNTAAANELNLTDHVVDATGINQTLIMIIIYGENTDIHKIIKDLPYIERVGQDISKRYEKSE